MTAQARLTLDDPTRPVPTRPTLFHVVGRESLAEPFDSLDALAARVAHLFGAPAFAGPVTPSAAVHQAAYPGFEMFPAWGLYAGPDRQWVGHAAVQATPRAQLEAALAAAVQPQRVAA